MSDIREAIEKLRVEHTVCGDPWYSCPKSSEGCVNDKAGTDCTCGADRHNALVDAALSLLPSAPQCWRGPNGKCPGAVKCPIAVTACYEREATTTPQPLPTAAPAGLPFNMRVDPSMPPTEIHVEQNGEEVGRIVNIAAPDGAREERDEGLEDIYMWLDMALEGWQSGDMTDASFAAEVKRALDEISKRAAHPAPALSEEDAFIYIDDILKMLERRQHPIINKQMLYCIQQSRSKLAALRDQLAEAKEYIEVIDTKLHAAEAALAAERERHESEMDSCRNDRRIAWDDANKAESGAKALREALDEARSLLIIHRDDWGMSITHTLTMIDAALAKGKP